MTKQEKTRASLKEAQEHMSRCGIIKTCGNCEHCNVEKSVCTLWNAQPPIKVVVEGCPKWVLSIPF